MTANRWLAYITFLFVVFTQPQPIHAQLRVNQPTGSALVNGLDVACKLGFSNLCDVTRPTSFSLLASNYTGKPIDGYLVLKDNWNGFEINLGEIYLAEQQTRRFSTIHDLSEWDHAVVELRLQDETLIWNEELLLQKHIDNSELKNVALIVGSGERELKFKAVPRHKLSSEVSENSRRSYRYRYGFQHETMPTTEFGTPVESVNAATWHLPTHHAPLLAVHAIVFTDDVDAYDINSSQWKAVAEWLCLGGRVFTNTKSKEIIAQLVEASPLSVEPPHQVETFSVRRIGAGAIYEFQGRIFSGSSNDTDQRVLAAIAALTPRGVTEILSVDSMPYDRVRIVDSSRTRIIILFLVYAFFSSFVMLAMFRRTRKQVAVYLAVVVGFAAVGAGIVGANLRNSKGYLRWLTISQPGVSGGSQISRLETRSTGARSSKLTLQGQSPDLQVTSADSSGYWLQHQVRAFTLQRNLLKDSEAFQTAVKITPWGRRNLYAADFVPDMQRLQVQLKMAGGRQLSLRIKNPLSVDIQSGKLILMATVDGRDERKRFFFEHDLPPVAAGQTHEAKMLVHLRPFDRNVNLTVFEGTRNASLPVLNRPNAVTAWIFASLSDSPSLKFDETRSDFSSLYQLHTLAQEVLPEKMPEYSEFGLFPDAPPDRQK